MLSLFFLKFHFTGAQVFEQPDCQQFGRFAFSVIPGNGERMFVLRAEDSDSRKAWLGALLNVLGASDGGLKEDEAKEAGEVGGDASVTGLSGGVAPPSSQPLAQQDNGRKTSGLDWSQFPGEAKALVLTAVLDDPAAPLVELKWHGIDDLND